RRDLGDDRTITRYADEVRTPARNALLYALTLGDSRATGPAAWSMGKAALVRELFVKADTWLGSDVPIDDGPDPRVGLAALLGEPAAGEYLDAMPDGYARAFPSVELARHHGLLTAGVEAVEWDALPDERWRCTLVAQDRTGLLATAAGALALVGFDIDTATAHL